MSWNETVIMDNNSSSRYPYGNITWSSQSIGALGADKLFVPSEGYVQIPIYTTLTIADGTFNFSNAGAAVPANACAIAHKSKLAWVNRVTERIGGVDVGLMTENRPYYQIMRAHDVNDEVSKKHYEEQLDHYHVSPTVRKWYDADVGQTENQSVRFSDVYSTLQSFDNYNDIFVKQGRKFQNYGVNTMNGEDVNPLSYLGNKDQPASLQLQKHVEVGTTTIKYYDILEIPLKHLSAIGNLPPCSTLNGLLLKLELPHCQTGVKMEVTYKTLGAIANQADKEFLPESFVYSAATSQLYPYIHGQVFNSLKVGAPLCARQTADNGKIKITCQTEIGWDTKLTGSVCRLVIPSVQVGEMMSKIVAQPKVKIDILDATVDTNLFQKVVNGQQFTNAMLTAPIAKPCRIYLLPFVHSSINGSTNSSPQMSPFSMAPVLTSPLNLINLQLHLSTQAVYPQPISTKRDYFNLYHKVVNSLVNGNSFHSAFRNGQMSFEEFCLAPIYCSDVSQRYLDEMSHADNKMIGFSFVADFGKIGNDHNAGQIVVVVESYQSFMFDRTTSLVGF